LDPFKNLLHRSIIVTIRALAGLLFVDQLLFFLFYKSLLHLLLQPSSYVADIAKMTMQPLLREKSNIIYNGGIDLLVVVMRSALLHRP
jgi:hypothetical protein